ncbi:MAG: glycosyl hydrolase [Planctomycetaceae bacterium]|nr:glycosyl hydrolase [Planctomycetaceae bacterium]MBK96841.1 glycosyl hydrolase [Planctomycetaceae bacterium]
MIRKLMMALPALLLASGITFADKKDDGFTTITNGKDFSGWKASENKDSWSMKNGAFVAHGPRSHLFFQADKPFKNFELKVDVMTEPGSNGGIYFHTQYQENGWPKFGYEAQVNITHGDPKKSGSLYGVVNVADPKLKDNEFYETHIIVKGRHVTIKLNGRTVVEYTEPKGKEAFSNDFERRLGEGTFALQCHDPKSIVHFKNIRVKRLD